MKRLWLFGALLLTAAGLSACGSGGGGGGSATTTPTAPQAFENQFGSGFGSAFRAAANSDPRDVSATDLTAVSFTAEPVAIP